MAVIVGVTEAVGVPVGVTLIDGLGNTISDVGIVWPVLVLPTPVWPETARGSVRERITRATYGMQCCNRSPLLLEPQQMSPPSVNKAHAV